MILRPFFCFYGGKWRAAKYYPIPKHNIIIEPFAGSAGYSLRHYTKKIIWLPFKPWRDIKSSPFAKSGKISKEAIWISDK